MYFVGIYLLMIRGGGVRHGLHVRVDKTSNLHIFLFFRDDVSQRQCHRLVNLGFKQHKESSYAEVDVKLPIPEKRPYYLKDLIYKRRLLLKNRHTGKANLEGALDYALSLSLSQFLSLRAFSGPVWLRYELGWAWSDRPGSQAGASSMSSGCQRDQRCLELWY